MPLFRIMERRRKRITFYRPERSIVGDIGNAGQEIFEWNENATGSKHDHTDGSSLGKLEQSTQDIVIRIQSIIQFTTEILIQ